MHSSRRSHDAAHAPPARRRTRPLHVGRGIYEPRAPDRLRREPSWCGRATSPTPRSGPNPTRASSPGIDFDRLYPLAGPIVGGGRPARRHAGHRDPRHPHAGLGLDGDPARAGLLPEEFPDPYLRVFDLSHGDVAYLRETSRSRSSRFFGTMASARRARAPSGDAAGHLRGNMDTRQLVRGATLYLPVQVGRRTVLLRATRTAAQGDGEVCVTGIEARCSRRCASRWRSGAASRARSSGPRRRSRAAWTPRRSRHDRRGRRTSTPRPRTRSGR